MASGLSNVTANQETAETPEECPAKKKSKFQTFKNFFVKKKRKEAPATPEENLLKSSQSSDNVNGPEAPLTHPDADQDSVSKVNMGSKAKSHDSLFVSDSLSSEANDGLASSQDSLHGKVKSLQLQLKQAIRLGSPPSLICGKKGDDGGTLSEDDGLPCSPPDISVLPGSSQGPQRTSSLSLEGSDSEDEQTSPEGLSRPVSSPVSLPLDFSEPANFAACLDNSAARHRIAVKHRACAKRKPASREVSEHSKVKILSARVSLRVEEEDPSSAVVTEPSSEEKSADVEMIETDDGGKAAEQRENEAAVSPGARPVSQTMEEELSAPDEEAEAGGMSTSSSEAELDEEKSLPEADFTLGLLGSPISLATPGGHHADTGLDSDGELPAVEQGSLLQEVLSSLECPLTSAFVLKPDARDQRVSGDQGECSPTEGLPDVPTERPSSSPTATQEEDEKEEGIISPNTDTNRGSRDEDEQLIKEEEHVESDEDEEAEMMSPTEVLLQKQTDFSVGKGEEAKEQDKSVEEEVMKQEEAMEREEVMEEEQEEAVVEQEQEEVVEVVEEEDSVVVEEVVAEKVEEEEAVVEEPVMEEVEEEDTVMEEEKVIIKEDDVIIEKIVMQHQEVEVRGEKGGIEVRVEISPEVLQQRAPAESEEEDDEEDVEDLKVEKATEINEPEDPEESKEAEPESDSGDLDSGEEDAQDLLSDSDSWSYLHAGSLERSEVNTEQFALEVTDDTTPPQPPGAAFSPSSEEPSSPADKPSPSAGIRVAQDAEEASSGPSMEEDHRNVPGSPEPGKLRFTIAPAWQRTISSGTSKDKESPCASPIRPEAFYPVTPETPSEPAPSPDPPQSPAPLSPVKQPSAQATGSAADSPFGIKLRKTPVLPRGDVSPLAGLSAEPAEPTKRPQSTLASAKPAPPKKPDPLEDSTAKLRKTPDASLSKGAGGPVTSPSWISVAKQKQRSFQENPIEETPARKGSLEKDEASLSTSPVTVSCSLEISKPAAIEKDGKRTTPPVQAGQDEPPWLALAKKKAKAWSEMPQIVQ